MVAGASAGVGRRAPWLRAPIAFPLLLALCASGCGGCVKDDTQNGEGPSRRDRPVSAPVERPRMIDLPSNRLLQRMGPFDASPSD